ncbi:CARDB domain-containing protein [Thermosulfurimonas sp. F29]|uniref:CARDB domain-containing protein n=1 Tax=Thermosulfurimonas sp. F29 TaxID=2867247 RepID=UPI001C840988|nr:CARDB domain-containing protein [Thermosulfurimonas sp. F29]MBX6423527.1 hypothetical protein [Thermosulfurimonas sp. F29]
MFRSRALKLKFLIFREYIAGGLALIFLMTTASSSLSQGLYFPSLPKTPIKPPPMADLAVTSIAFSPKGTSATVTITVTNVGTARSPATKLSAVLIRQRGKLGKSWNLKPLNPGQSTRISWTIKPGAGINTLRATVKDPVNRKNNTLQKSFPFFPRTPARKIVISKTRRAFPLKRHVPGRMVKNRHPQKKTPFPFKPGMEKHLKNRMWLKAAKKPPGISTYEGSMAMFVRPRKGEVLPVGESYRVEWTLPEEMKGPDHTTETGAHIGRKPAPDSGSDPGQRHVPPGEQLPDGHPPSAPGKISPEA